MPRFAANLSFLYTEQPFLERFGAAAENGFQGVEYLSPYEWPAHQIASLLNQHDLQQVLFNAPAGGADREAVCEAWKSGLRGTAAIPGCEGEFRYGIELALEYAQALSCQQIHVMSGVVPDLDGASSQAVRKTWLNNLTWAASRAAESQCVMLIEPINHHDMPGYYLHTLQQAHEAVKLIDHPNLAVQMDFYHVERTEGNVLQQLRQYLPQGHIRHCQIAGVPGRHEPDVGELPYRQLLNELDVAGWGGWVGCEYIPTSITGHGLGWRKPWSSLR